MSDVRDTFRIPPRSRAGRISVVPFSFGLPVIALALAAGTLSAVTVTARGRLWLGPQTFVLGSVGICIGAAIVVLSWSFTRSREAELLDRPLLSRRGVLVSIIAGAILAAA